MFQTFVLLIVLSKGHAILWAKQDNISSYKDYQLWQANITNMNLTSEFETMIADEDVLNSNAIPNIPSEDVWHRCDNNIDFLLNGNETEYWNKFLESQNISYKVLLDDVQKAIEKEDLMKNSGDWRRDGKINWSSYPKLNDIYDYIQSIAAANPNYCTLQIIGKTVHRKDIKMLKLSNGNVSNEAFLIDAGMHGREWEGVISLLYFIENIAWNFTKQPNYIKNKDWYIVPVINPDGYEYSMTKDRLWRKNRRLFSGPCDGVDLNRNFDSNWGTRGASNDICSLNYCGPEPFSEQETIAIRNVITSRHFVGYVGIHSYGSAVLFPWIFDGRPTYHGSVHTAVAKEMVMAMRRVANGHFRAGTVSLLHMKTGSGNELDWAYGQSVHHTYVVETRGFGSGQFKLEPNQLRPALLEVTAGLRRMAEVIT